MSNPRGGGGGSLHELVFQVFLFFILKVFIEFVTILLLFFFFFNLARRHVVSLFPDQGLNPYLLYWRGSLNH